MANHSTSEEIVILSITLPRFLWNGIIYSTDNESDQGPLRTGCSRTQLD